MNVNYVQWHFFATFDSDTGVNKNQKKLILCAYHTNKFLGKVKFIVVLTLSAI